MSLEYQLHTINYIIILNEIPAEETESHQYIILEIRPKEHGVLLLELQYSIDISYN